MDRSRESPEILAARVTRASLGPPVASSPIETRMIFLANAAVVFFVCVVLFFSLLATWPSPKKNQQRDVPSKAAARRKDGRYTAEEVALHCTEARSFSLCLAGCSLSFASATRG
jgi:hypothetical protein